VSASHVEQALRAKTVRNSRIEERMRDLAAEGTVIVETGGAAGGAGVNGLAVLRPGGTTASGRPSRITATVYAGKGGVLNIERETKLSGEDPREGGPHPLQLPGEAFRREGFPSA